MAKYEQIRILFGANGKQSGLEIDYRNDKGERKTGKWREPKDKPDHDPTRDKPDKVLWDGADSLVLVEGSNCVVIGARKYCTS